ncbi:MAG: hypothetical protein IKL53_04270 [Lachnospiraceae bacterium]|nr:hypothetical protein [Lachnospiraceae bacterium]
MSEQLRDNYFLAVKIIMLIALELYIALTKNVLTGASGMVLLLLALLIGCFSLVQLFDKLRRWMCLCGCIILLIVITTNIDKAFVLLGICLAYDIISYFQPGFIWYFTPLIFGIMGSDINSYVRILACLFIGIIYIQHDFIVESYRKQTVEDTLSEQQLKKNIYKKEHEMQEEMRKGLLQAENQLLEERTQLSQTLHDKLGHNINGSVYQLEAIKVIMDKEPETSKRMIQGVIDQLRTGMDEIRAILRKERPKKYRLATIQLEKLCEDCVSKGVDAKLVTDGDLSNVPDKYLEIVLDNAYEAVSNAMKYARCTKIEIKIHVLNQMLRCSISDNGIGCKEIEDGMGISGMRRRVREVNGVLDFETEAGFTINMLLPINEG